MVGLKIATELAVFLLCGSGVLVGWEDLIVVAVGGILILAVGGPVGLMGLMIRHGRVFGVGQEHARYELNVDDLRAIVKRKLIEIWYIVDLEIKRKAKFQSELIV